MSKQVRSRYREAARAFVNADLETTLVAIEAALAALPAADTSPNWIDLLSEESPSPSVPLHDQRRKVVILFVTLIATCRATAERDLSKAVKTSPLYHPYSSLSPEAASTRLFDATLPYFTSSPSPSSDPLPLPSPEAGLLPPSVIVALTLGALKLQAPRAAKAICEAWLGSLPEQAETLLEAEGDAYDSSSSTTTSASSLTASSLSLSVTSTPSNEAGGGSPKRNALLSYERILELYALHVLPGLGAWEEAEEWVKLLARENGGWARVGKVEWLSVALRDTRANALTTIEQQRLRQEAQVEHDKQLKRKKPAASLAPPTPTPKRSKRTSRKVNGHASSDDHSSAHSSPPKGSEAKLASPSITEATSSELRKRADAQLTGFAAMRAALADYLQPSRSVAKREAKVGGMEKWMRMLGEQSRLLGLLAFVFTFLAWRRRARRSLIEQAGEGVGKVWETIRMATRTTYL